MMVSVDAIDALLPQTQCTECGYPGCKPYAQALAAHSAPIDRCPPGGIDTLMALGKLLNVDPEPYRDQMKQNTRSPSVAHIRESECIGCTKCIQACPVDAIVGSSKMMHTVVNHDCTGCGLCVEPCPVDCIDLIEVEEPLYDKNRARQQFNARKIRLLRLEQEKEHVYREKRRLALETQDQKLDRQAKQEYIKQAMNRVSSKKTL